jgi:hypothetical protein
MDFLNDEGELLSGKFGREEDLRKALNMNESSRV